MFAYLRLSRSWSYPLLGWPSRLLGQPLGYLGLYRPEGKSSDPCPLCGKRVQSAREDEPSGMILVGRDRDRWCVSHGMTWRHVMVGSETEMGG